MIDRFDPWIKMMLHEKTINIDTVLSHGDKGSESGFNNYND